MIFAGPIVVPTRRHDPVGTVVFPIHNDPRLNGLSLPAQGIHLVLRSLRPRLTNRVATRIRH